MIYATRYSTSTILQVKVYTSEYQKDDPVCSGVTEFISLLEQLPKKSGTEKEMSILKSVGHSIRITDEQLYNKKKSIPQVLASLLTDLLKTYTELGEKINFMVEQTKPEKFMFIISKLL